MPEQTGVDPRMGPAVTVLDMALALAPVGWRRVEWQRPTGTLVAYPGDGPQPLHEDAPLYLEQGHAALDRLAEVLPQWPGRVVTIEREGAAGRLTFVDAAEPTEVAVDGEPWLGLMVWKDALLERIVAEDPDTSIARGEWRFDAAHAELEMGDLSTSAQLVGRWAPPFHLQWAWQVGGIDTLGWSALEPLRREPPGHLELLGRSHVLVGACGARAVCGLAARWLGARPKHLARGPEVWSFLIT